MEEKKNIPLDNEIKDEELDQVAGGRGNTGKSGVHGKDSGEDERPKNPTAPDLQYECTGCGNWTRGSTLDNNGSICRICKKPIDRNTARWST